MKLEFHSIQCKQCQRVVTVLSQRAAYCSDACRSAAYRQRKRHANNETVPGLTGNAAVLLTEIYNQSPSAVRLIQALRKKRGVSAARDAVYIAIAALWNGALDPASAYFEYFNSELPDYLKETDNAA